MENCLTGSEAILGFCAWLTNKKEKTIMSSNDDIVPTIESIKIFCEKNKLPDPRDNYADYLTMPPTEQETTEQENPNRHQQRHILLHAHLDELIADYMCITGNLLPSKASLIDLIEWSYQQTISPTCEKQL